MGSIRAVPEPWASRMVACGFTDARHMADVPSVSAPASKVEIHATTIGDAIHGRRKPSAETVAALVAALGDDVAAWRGVGRVSAWTRPADAALLTDRQRNAVEEIIRAMTERQEQDHDTASTTDAGATPAPKLRRVARTTPSKERAARERDRADRERTFDPDPEGPEGGA